MTEKLSNQKLFENICKDDQLDDFDEFDIDQDFMKILEEEASSDESSLLDSLLIDTDILPKSSTKSKKIKKDTSNEEVESLRDEDGLPEYKGTIDLKTLDPNQKKALDAFMFKGTKEEIVDPEKRSQSRVLPMTEPKSDHLLIKGIKLSKEMKTGEWIISEVETNQGSFAMGIQQNKRLDQKSIRSLALYLRTIFEDDLNDYLKEE